MESYLYYIKIILAIIIFFSQKWRDLTDIKKISEGLMETKNKNILFNSLNGMIHYSIPEKFRTPFLNWREIIPEAWILIDNFNVIRKECLRVANGDVPQFKDIDPNQKPLADFGGKKWSTFFFKFHDKFNKENCEKCPETAKLLKTLPVDVAMFSIMEKGKVLFPHRGPWKGVLRLHFGIEIPPMAKINVDKKDYFWKEGELVLFDDTYIHHTSNPNGRRIILFMDIKRNHIPPIFHEIALKNASSYIRETNKKIQIKGLS